MASNAFLEAQKHYQEELRRLQNEGDDLIEHLNHMLSQKIYLEDKIKNLSKITPALKQIRNDAKEVVDTVHDISKSSEEISGKIRTLDDARNRVEECQQRVSDLNDLEMCSDGVEAAILAGEYERAAALIHRFLSMDQYQLKQTASDMNVSHISKSVRTLNEAATQLRDIVEHHFNEAIQKEDLPAIERYFKLFPLLGLHEEGITKFCTYLRSKVASAADKNINSAVNMPTSHAHYGMVYSETLVMLFEGVAQLLEQRCPFIETNCGPGRLITAVKVLQSECDQQARRILFKWESARQIQKKLEQFSMKPSSSYSKLERIDPKEVDLLISETTAMHGKCENYFRFIRNKVLSDIEIGIQDPSKQAEARKQLETFINNCGLSQCKHDILSRYLEFEKYYMEESLEKAASIDSVDDTQVIPTSSVVDDTFFIIDKCIKRSISTQSLEGICVVINNACRVLENNFCEILRSKLKQGYPSGYVDMAYSTLQTSIQQGRFQSADTEQSKILYLAALNNADNSIEHVETLCVKVMERINKFLNLNQNERGKLESCLSGLSSVTIKLKDIIEYGIKQLHYVVIKPRVSGWIESFMTYKHDLTEDEVRAYESGDTFIQKLKRNLMPFLKNFKETLTPSNFNLFAQIFVTEITKKLEDIVIKVTYNIHGGYILDKELRDLNASITSEVDWSVRDKFAKLMQMATVLNLEHMEEINEYKSQSNWRLTAQDMKRLLSLRSEFRLEDISKLRL